MLLGWTNVLLLEMIFLPDCGSQDLPSTTEDPLLQNIIGCWHWGQYQKLQPIDLPVNRIYYTEECTTTRKETTALKNLCQL